MDVIFERHEDTKPDELIMLVCGSDPWKLTRKNSTIPKDLKKKEYIFQNIFLIAADKFLHCQHLSYVFVLVKVREQFTGLNLVQDGIDSSLVIVHRGVHKHVVLSHRHPPTIGGPKGSRPPPRYLTESVNYHKETIIIWKKINDCSFHTSMVFDELRHATRKK
jgi:hypothetical protein